MQSQLVDGTLLHWLPVRKLFGAMQTVIILVMLCFNAIQSLSQSSEGVGRTVVSSGTYALPTVSKEVQEVNVLFTATDHRGHFVRDLKESDFIIRDNGEPPARITYFESQAELPLRLALVIDHSASFTYCLNYEKKAASLFLKQNIRPGIDLALIVAFNEKAHLLQAPTSDRFQLASAIGRIRKTDGNTAIFDAVSFASEELAKIQDKGTTRRAIVLMTDGMDNQSHRPLEEVERIAQENENAVYVISANDPTEKSDSADDAMTRLAEATGGNFLRATNEDAVAEALSKTGSGLRNQYLIAYVPTAVRPDGSFHRLVVLGPKKIRVHHRMAYLAR